MIGKYHLWPKVHKKSVWAGVCTVYANWMVWYPISARTCRRNVCVCSLLTSSCFESSFSSSTHSANCFSQLFFSLSSPLYQINKPASPKHAPVSPASTLDKRVQQPKQPVKVQGKHTHTHIKCQQMPVGQQYYLYLHFLFCFYRFRSQTRRKKCWRWCSTQSGSGCG